MQACLAGLAWIAGGSSLRSGKHKPNLDKAVKDGGNIFMTSLSLASKQIMAA